MRDPAKDVYSDPCIADIAAGAGIAGPDLMHALKERLETAAAMYRASIHNEARPGPKEIDATYVRIAELGRELVDVLDRMDDLSWRHFGITGDRLPTDCFFGEDKRMEEIGAFHRTETGATFLGLDDATAGVRFLILCAEEARKRVPQNPSAGGRPPHRALNQWASTMVTFWTHDLVRTFTVDFIDQEPLSPAAQFLASCLAPLDVEALPQLEGQMLRIRRSGKNPS